MRALIISLGWVALIMFTTSCVENINPPEVENQEFSLDENSPAGTIVGVVIAYDLDNQQPVSFRIREGDDDGTFEIDQTGGHLSVADPLKLDYELQAQLVISVLVSDDHPRNPMESMATITIHLNDLNEFAPVVEDQTFEIEENPTMGDTIGIILASDPEEHQGLNFTTVSGNEEMAFALDAETGTLMVHDPSAFDYDINQQFALTVRVRDIHLDSKSDTAVITIKVNNVI
ncbi:MAG: cadherin repeat domain-containing protein [Bacteroidota bacterium]